jgi:hypothetical protein
MAKSKFEELTKYFLFLNGGIHPKHFLQIFESLKRIDEPKEQVAIDLIISSGGGYGKFAFQMARVLRDKCQILRSVVPLYAKSAATLLVLASDVILMGAQSELGPLDTQIEHPNEGKSISALDHVGSLEFLGSLAHQWAFFITEKARKDIFLSRIDSINIGIQFAEEFIKPLIAKLDPSLLHQSQRGLGEAELYSIILMKCYMFKEDKNPKEKSEKIANELVWNYKTHSYVIDIHEAKRLGLKVESIDSYPYKETAWKLARQYALDNEERILLFSEKELEEIINSGHKAEEDDQKNDNGDKDNNGGNFESDAED